MAYFYINKSRLLPVRLAYPAGHFYLWDIEYPKTKVETSSGPLPEETEDGEGGPVVITSIS